MTPEERWDHIDRTFAEIAETQKSSAEAFDRRINKITERHEALAQTVEVIAGMQRANEERVARNEVRLAQLMDTMNRLANIVVAHDQRLDNLEKR